MKKKEAIEKIQREYLRSNPGMTRNDVVSGDSTLIGIPASEVTIRFYSGGDKDLS